MAMCHVFALAFLAAAITSHAQKLRGSGGDTQAQRIALKSGCKGHTCDGVPEDRFAVLLEQGRASIHIGDSTSDQKCVTHPTPVSCEANAADPDKRLNDRNLDYDDRFIITVNGGREVCARRTDKQEGWNQPLRISCKDEQKKTEKCMCLTSAEGDCACKGCTDEEQQQTCSELLGPCTCQRSEQGICDCYGYCSTRDDRKEACQEEAGCEWTGMWCQAQLGLLWS